MAIVTITEAARLTGKSRRTIQRHLSQGVISKCDNGTNGQGIDTTELLRVYGAFTVTDNGTIDASDKSQPVMPDNTPLTHATMTSIESAKTIIELRKENEMLKLLLDEKDKRNDDLRQALLMLEDKRKPTGIINWLKRIGNKE